MISEDHSPSDIGSRQMFLGTSVKMGPEESRELSQDWLDSLAVSLHLELEHTKEIC